MKGLTTTVAGMIVLACSSIVFPDGQPAIEGEIVGIGETVPFARGSATKIWVKEDPADECGIVFSTVGAEIGERRLDGSIKKRGFQDLAVGQHVRVWSFNIADSCPGQSGADAIEILPD